ncbi:unknown [Coraliomargarita sp. CAG:312]|nr:unknown [Coraliomargarita sp. CAG:312]
MTRTFLPFADISKVFDSPELKRNWAPKYSRAKCTPDKFFPATSSDKPRGICVPKHKHSASNFLHKYSAEISAPISTPPSNNMPELLSISRRRSIMLFLSLKSGIPYRKSPPKFTFFSNTTTSCPHLFNASAAASPEGPDPMTATRIPVWTRVLKGSTYPRLKAFSIISYSICRMATGSKFMPAQHAASQRAGHTREVNSGNGDVWESRKYASRSRFSPTALLNSCIGFPSGQPAPWQKGIPHPMHRDA